MEKRNVAAMALQQTEQKYPTLVEILDDGYGPEFVQTLTDSIQRYARALAADGDCMYKYDADNLYNLVWLLKAILKDCCGVDVE